MDRFGTTKILHTDDKSRAFYKDSFDNIMKKFAAAWMRKEKNLQKKQLSSIFDMALDYDLPSHETILQGNSNARSMQLNKTLKEQEDAIPI